MEEIIVSLKHVSKIYQTQFALKDIDLEIRRGEIFGIIGMSGAGKSTLMRCLTGLEKPTEGSVLFSNSAKKKFGMIFQHFNLFSSRSAFANISYPLEIAGVPLEKRKQRVKELLELVGLKERGAFYPAELSGGEKQRVAIARALANHPQILFCDEATSALDPRTTRSILSLISELNERLGLTIVLITHEMAVIKQICTHVAVLEHGQIVEKGEARELFVHPKHPTTLAFLQNMVHEVPEHFYSDKSDAVLLRLSFSGGSAKEPVISRLIRQYAVEVNILMGGIDLVRNETIGNLVIELTGDREERYRARAFLESQGVVCDELI